jgi:outer membrane protein OmpA-like peptidoglycan-associated protein/uncharacterized protein YidB (DUF937 family)
MATTLDNLIMESGRRSGIGPAAEPLTRELLRLMTGGPGGLGAFLDRFRSAGLGAEITSFLGGRSDAELPAKAVDSVIGEATVANMARRVGVAPAAASTAMGFEIPRLIGLLTPGGKVPTALPTDIREFVGEGDQVNPVDMAVVRDEERARPVAMATVEEERVRPVAMATVRESRPGWLWALLALPVLGALIWAMLPRARPPAPVAPAVAPVVAPAPAPPRAVTATVTTLNRDLGHNVLNFATNSAVLPADSAPLLHHAADQIRTLPGGTVIEVAGHTDNTGNPTANMSLSQRRADAVRNALIHDGDDAAMLTAKGYGDTKPIASNDTPDGRLQNRRTEFNVVGQTTETTTTTTTRSQ